MSGKMSTFTKKRIFADVRELKEDASSEYVAEPLEDNIFEWHFTIRGPKDTDFEGGLYHGRILLPNDYPFKPPNIVFLTPNGRFEVNKKICLSISAHHPEEWQAAWGIRLILEALISFLPTEGGGALGALDWSAFERKKLAKSSQCFCCDRCGKVSDLFKSLQSSDEDNEGLNAAEDKSSSKKTNKYADAIAQLHCHVPVSPINTPKKSTPSSDDDDDVSKVENFHLDGFDKVRDQPVSTQGGGGGDGGNLIESLTSMGDDASTLSLINNVDVNDNNEALPELTTNVLRHRPLQRQSNSSHEIHHSTAQLSSQSSSANSLSREFSGVSPQLPLHHGQEGNTSPSASSLRNVPAQTQQQGATASHIHPNTSSTPRQREHAPVRVEEEGDPLLILAYLLGSAIALILLRKLCRILGIDELSPL